jgi:hypothetical protein
MEKNNKLPEYVSEELVPRFSGTNSMTLANVKATNNEIINGGHYILSKESRYKADSLFLSFNRYKHTCYAIITLLSKQEFDHEKRLEEGRMHCDGTSNLLWGYYVNPYQIYVTPKGFTEYFNIKTLESEIGVEYKERYSFNENKLKVDRGYLVRNNIVPGIVTYGILDDINPEYLEFTTIEQDESLGRYKLPIENVVNGTIEIEPVDL